VPARAGEGEGRLGHGASAGEDSSEPGPGRIDSRLPEDRLTAVKGFGERAARRRSTWLKLAARGENRDGAGYPLPGSLKMA
jgi:hypothetical protein